MKKNKIKQINPKPDNHETERQDPVLFLIH